jgi:urea transport system substrate-binding protein
LGSSCATSTPSPVDADVINVGFVVPLTGPDRASAEPAIQGASVAIADVKLRQAAGVWKLRLVQVNDQSDATAARQACASLASTDRVAAIVGVESASPRDACASAARAAGVPYLWVGRSTGSECTRDAFYLSPLPGQRMTALVQFLIQQRHLKRFYVVGDSSAESTTLLGAATVLIRTLGGTVLASDLLPAVPNFAQVNGRIALARPDVTIDALSGSAQSSYYAAVSADQALAKTPFASLDLDETAANEITPAAAGIYVARDYLSADPAAGNQAWLTALISRYGDGAVPTASGAQVYDAIELLAASIRTASSPTPAAILQAMTGVSVDGPGGSVAIKAASHGYPTLAMHIGRLDSSHLVSQLFVTQPIDPVVACT